MDDLSKAKSQARRATGHLAAVEPQTITTSSNHRARLARDKFFSATAFVLSS